MPFVSEPICVLVCLESGDGLFDRSRRGVKSEYVKFVSESIALKYTRVNMKRNYWMDGVKNAMERLWVRG